MQQKKSTTINVPSPCAEKWATMLPTAEGRHCTACQETVADFTRFSDAELVAFLQTNSSVRCGRFREDQTNRLLHLQPPQAPRWRTWLVAASALLGGRALLPASAQAQTTVEMQLGAVPIPDADEQPAVQTATTVSRSTPDSVLIQGSVHNKWGRPLSAYIIIKTGEKRIVKNTNIWGRFRLRLPADLDPHNTYFSIAQRGHRGVRMSIAEFMERRTHVFFLEKRSQIISGKFR